MTATVSDRPLRILNVIDGLELGGAQTVLLGLVKLVDRAQFDVSVATTGAYHPHLIDAFRDAGADVTVLPSTAIWDLRSLATLVRTIRSRRIDAVHTHLAAADVLGGLAARATRRPVVSTLHSVAEDRLRYRTRRRVLSDLATRLLADRVIAVSDAVRESHVRALGVPPERVTLVPNVSVAPYVLAPAFDRERKRAELGAAGRLLVSVVARIDEKRDHETLVRALVCAVPPELLVLVVGDGSRRAAAERLAHDLGVSDRIRFLGLRTDAVEIAAASDVVCQPTLYEGMPIAVLDAMTMGVAVVASAAPGVIDLVEDDVSGLLVPPRDSDALADALARLGDPVERRRLADGARRAVAERYDPERWIRTTEAIYRELVAGSSSLECGGARQTP